MRIARSGPEDLKEGAEMAERRDVDHVAIAKAIVGTPALREKFFENPNTALARALPSQRWHGVGVDGDTRENRRRVLEQIGDAIREMPEAASGARSRAVTRQFFGEAIRNPVWSFWAILGLSLATFGVGAALIISGLIMAWTGDDSTRETVIAGVFGGSGVVGTLGAVFKMASGGVSRANATHAQIRVILAGFATELGHLRAIKVDEDNSLAFKVNKEIESAVDRTVRLIQKHVKVDPESGSQQAAEMTGGEGGEEKEKRTNEPTLG
jgi:hypothetical protein